LGTLCPRGELEGILCLIADERKGQSHLDGDCKVPRRQHVCLPVVRVPVGPPCDRGHFGGCDLSPFPEAGNGYLGQGVQEVSLQGLLLSRAGHVRPVRAPASDEPVSDDCENIRTRRRHLYCNTARADLERIRGRPQSRREDHPQIRDLPPLFGDIRSDHPGP